MKPVANDTNVPAPALENFGTHAQVVGEITDDLLNTPISIAFGKHVNDMDWRNEPGTMGQLLQLLGTFQFGPKDGLCILQGNVVAPRRIAKNVARNHLLLIDIDTGATVEEVGTILVERGLFGVIWTTHSFGKDATEIPEEHFTRWLKKTGASNPSEADLILYLARYLTTEKKYKARVMDGVSRDRIFARAIPRDGAWSNGDS